MKKLILVLIYISSYAAIWSQELGGYELQDALSTAVHPKCPDYDNRYIVGWPNDSIWVDFNLNNNSPIDTIHGTFNEAWSAGPGKELLLESGFNLDNYIVHLQLADGSYSEPKQVESEDWTDIPSVSWQYAGSFPFCGESEQPSFAQHRIFALDFETDFGLDQADLVTGIRIIFLFSPGAADLAGAYITEHALACGSSANLGPDTTICIDQSLTLQGGTYANYLWSDGSTDSLLTINGATIGSGTFTYSLETVDSLGCVYTDSITVTVEICTDTYELNLEEFKMVYPNPATDQITIVLPNFTSPHDLKLYALNGQLIQILKISEKEIIVDISDWPNGNYIGFIGKYYFKFIKK